MNRLLHAVQFAAEKHTEQRRKNKRSSPYINHPVEVAHHLTSVGKVEDEDLVIAALLHDTIEDTETSREEIGAAFGETVAELVMECTDDKSLPKQERKRLQILNAPKKSSRAKLIKIADKTCNLRSILADPPCDWSRQRQYEYFQWAEQVVAGLLGENAALDYEVNRVLREGLDAFQTEADRPGAVGNNG